MAKINNKPESVLKIVLLSEIVKGRAFLNGGYSGDEYQRLSQMEPDELMREAQMLTAAIAVHSQLELAEHTHLSISVKDKPWNGPVN